MVENCAFDDEKRKNRMAGQDAFLTQDCSVESKLGFKLYEQFETESTTKTDFLFHRENLIPFMKKIINQQETVCQQSEKI